MYQRFFSFLTKIRTFLEGLKIPSGSSWVGLSTILNTIISFAFNVYVTSHLSKDSYGVYQYVFSLSGIVSNLTLTGLKNSITQSVARNKNRFFTKIFKFSLKTNLPIFFVFSLVGLYFKFIKHDELVSITCFVLALCQPLTISSSIFEGFLQGEQNFKKLCFFSCSLNIFVSLGTAILITTINEIIYGIIFSIVARSLLTFAQFIYIHINSKNSGHDEFQYNEVKKQALHFSVSSFLGGTNSYLDKIVMHYFFGFTAVAEIAVINYLPNFYRAFSKASHTVLLPHLAKKSSQNAWSNFGTTMFFLLLSGIVITAPIAMGIPYFITWFFPRYSNNILYAQMSCLEIIFLLPGIYLGSLLKAKRKNKEIYQFTTINGIVKTLSIIIFGKIFGVPGIVFSKLFSSFFGLSTSTILLTRSLKHERQK